MTLSLYAMVPILLRGKAAVVRFDSADLAAELKYSIQLHHRVGCVFKSARFRLAIRQLYMVRIPRTRIASATRSPGTPKRQKSEPKDRNWWRRDGLKAISSANVKTSMVASKNPTIV